MDIAELGLKVDSRGFVRAERDLKRFDKTAGRVDQTAEKLARSAQRLGRAMSVGVTLPIIASGAAAAKTASQFQSSLAQMNTLVGVSRKEIAQFRQGILDLAPAVGRGPIELADAMFAVTSAGARGADAMEILEASAKAAALGLGETRSIALTAGAAVTAFGKESLSASEAVDILIGTVEQGNLEASSLSRTLGNVISIASSVGASFADVGTFIAAFTRQGVKAEQAVTGLRGTLAILAREPTAETKKALGELDTTIDEVRRSVREDGFIATFQELARAAQENGVSMARIIPEVEALAGSLAVFTSEGESATDILGKVEGAVGTLEARLKAAQELDPSLAFSQMTAELETLRIEIGANVLPIMLDLAETVREISEDFRDLAPETQQNIVKFAGLAAAIGPVLIVGGLLITSLRGIAGALIAVRKAAIGAGGASGALKRLIPLLGRAGIAGVMILAANETRKFRKELFEGIEESEDFIEALEKIRGELDKEPSDRLMSTINDGIQGLREEAERLEGVLNRIRLERQTVSPISGITGGDAPGESAEEREAKQRLETVRELTRFAQQAAGAKEFEDISNAIELVGEVSDFVTPKLRALGEAFGFVADEAKKQEEDSGEAGSEAAKTTEEWASALKDLRAEVDGPAAKAVREYEKDLLELLDAVEENKLETEDFREFQKLLEEQLKRTRAEIRTEELEAMDRAQDDAADSLRKLVDELEEHDERVKDFREATEDMAASLEGAAAVAELEFVRGIQEAQAALAAGEVGVDGFRERVELLREEFERGREKMFEFEKAGQQIGQNITTSLLNGQDLGSSIGSALTAFGQEPITEAVGEAMGRAFEKLPDSEAFKTGLAVGSLAIGQALEGEIEQGVGTALGAAFGSLSFTPFGAGVGAAVGGLIGSIFGGDSVPKFQVRGRESDTATDAGTDRLISGVFGDIEFAFRDVGDEAQAQIVKAFVQFDRTLAGVIRDNGDLSEIEDALDEFGVSSRSGPGDIEEQLKLRLNAVLSTFDDFVGNFVNQAFTLEEKVQRLADIFAIENQLLLGRGFGLSGDLSGFDNGPGFGGGGGATPIDPGGGGIGPGPGIRPSIQQVSAFNATINDTGDAAEVTNPALQQTLLLLDELSVGSESLQETFARLASVVGTLDTALALTNGKLAESREGLVRFGADLAAIFGDDAGAVAAQFDRIFEAFFSDEERFTAAADQAAARGEELLRSLLAGVEGVDFADEFLTQSGFRELFDELLQSGELSADQLALLSEAGVAIAGLIDAEQSLADARGESIDRLTDEWRRAVDSIADALNNQLTGPASSLTPQQRLNESEFQLRQLVAQAQAGSLEAARQIPELFNQTIGLGAGFFGTSTEGFAAFETDLRNLLSGLELGPDQVSVAQAQLNQLQLLKKIQADQLLVLQDIREAFRNTPEFSDGGPVQSTGFAQVHAGEFVVPSGGALVGRSEDAEILKRIEKRLEQGNDDRRAIGEFSAEEQAQIRQLLAERNQIQRDDQVRPNIQRRRVP